MNIEFLNKNQNELLAELQMPEGYRLADANQIIETVDFKKEKELFEERKRIHLDGVYINIYKRSQIYQRETWVRSDASYLQMHFELNAGSAYYYHKNNTFDVPIAKGHCSLFYVPELDGKLVDPPCQDALTVEIEISEKWIRDHIGVDQSMALNFVHDIAAERPSLFAGKSQRISSQLFKTLTDLFNCPYTGNIKRLFLEAKLMEILAYQLLQAQDTVHKKNLQSLSKIDIEQLHFIKEKISANLAVHHSIEELSYLSNMNRTKLQAGFKILFGSTIHDFLVEQRMQLAYHMLSESYQQHWNISEIAQRVGYQYSNHFSTAFKNKFGLSPRDFLK